MSIAALIRSMADAGAPAEAIALAVEAIEAANGAAGRQREAARERKRRQRAIARDEGVTVTGQSRDTNETVTLSPLPLPPSPQTPQPPTPTPGESSIARKGRSGSSVDGGFEAFWSAYPLSKGKDAARPAFTKAMARIDAEDPLAVILAGIERALPGWDLVTKAFIPHPATWLNQGRWKDEPEQHQPQAQGQPHERRHPPTDKFERHQANLERAVAGSQLAARLRAIEPEGSF